jgi:hypothetical protein
MLFWISRHLSIEPRAVIQFGILFVRDGPGSVKAAVHNTCRVPSGYRGGILVPWTVISR